MKILVYNWVPFDGTRGGGVTVYTKNLILSLMDQYPDGQIYFLCAGSYYDTEDKSIRYERISLSDDIDCKAFSIINSPVFAPAYISFLHMKYTLEDSSLKPIFLQFLSQEGPFDVIHFQNFEGLSLDVLSCKEQFPNTKFIYSIHNYYAFCPRVDLWQNNSKNCDCLDTGEECLKCITCKAPREKLIRKMSLTYDLREHFSVEKQKHYDELNRMIDEEYHEIEHTPISEEDSANLVEQLQSYRKRYVEYINKYMDCILAVSRRVYDIALRHGIDKAKMSVSYIGTQVAEIDINIPTGIKTEYFSIAYMGYQNIEKGFFFFLNMLDEIDDEIASKICVYIYAKGNTFSQEQLNKLKKKFADVIFQEGYSREEIPKIMSRIDLGIVPVLWEDNLPQVAIEMAAYGVPVLSSDLGGASELTCNKEFVFKAGDISECKEKIVQFVNCPEKLKEYYDDFPGLTTMKQHIDELWKYYI